MSRRRHERSVLAALVIGVVLAACAGASTPPTSVGPTVATASPSPTVAPTGPFALRSGALPPGEYTTTAFEPTLMFTLGDGWLGLFPDDDDEVALEGPGGAFFAISRVSEVVDPTTRAAVAAPDDLIEWMTTHPQLTAETPTVVTIAGLSAQTVDVTVTDGSEREIFAFPSGNLKIPEGVTYRCHVLRLDGPDMTIIIGAPKAAFADAVENIQPVLDSMGIAAGG